jgi:hypothetical protein
MRRSLTSSLSTMFVVAVLTSACATIQPPNPNGPRADAQPYPMDLTSEPDRVDEVRLAWRQLAQRFGISDRGDPRFNPITATIDGLPPNVSGSLFLPKVGGNSTQTEEETRESLRRFISDWQELIGAEPTQLSLVERTDDPAGIKMARYEQRPFRYPLRGGFGKLVIRFRGNRQLVDLSSNCLPNADRLQSLLVNLSPQLSWDEAAANVKGGRSITIGDGVGGQQSFIISHGEEVEVRQLVVYVLAASDQTKALEVHLAWEISIPNGPIKTLYVDAISGQVIAGS